MQTFLDQTVQAYVDVAASNAPTPGGGSISALAGALGNAMASMAANFTLGKKKFAEVEPEIRSILDSLDASRTVFLSCVDEDAKAFAAIGEAYSLPKDTDEQKTARRDAIQQSLAGAMQVPLRILQETAKCIGLLPRLAEIGNPNLVSDTGVAAILLEAAAQGAILNIKINLASLKDEHTVAKTEEEMNALIEKITSNKSQTMKTVNNKISS